MINLQFEPYMDVYDKIYEMTKIDPEIKKIFYLKRDRLLSSVIFCLIKNNNIDIGFINMVKEYLDGIYFLDEGILEKYRNRGYGREALLEFKRLVNFDKYLIGETMKNNILSNGSANGISELIYETNDTNYYLFQPELKDKFIQSREYVKLKEYIDKRKRLLG